MRDQGQRDGSRRGLWLFGALFERLVHRAKATSQRGVPACGREEREQARVGLPLRKANLVFGER